ncbi:hypothetical protein WJX81_007986 [Elliptochloris bilobata]|uniref:inorganic diphosphatase n=1 Tax=Elliptochloris bilobata TaxID=381761 RepID=A0AAW1RGI6_9CHLO
MFDAQVSVLQPWAFGGLAPLTSRWVLGGVAALSALTQPEKSAAREHASAELPYTSQSVGEPGTLEQRVFIYNAIGTVVSPWHDIPLYLKGGLLSFVCEIPAETRKKVEVATDEALTPIKQDVKEGKPRYYPYNIHWNYGMLPQTWEDPTHSSAAVGGLFGDNDPVDVVEIGSAQLMTGSVYAVKPLAVLAMIDDGELDWKVIAIRVDDPLAAGLEDVEDVERELPGLIERIRVWFRDYKTPDGKPQSRFAFDGKPQNKDFALQVIAETHGFYNALKASKVGGRLSLV